MLAKGKEKQTPPRPLIPWAVGTCSLSSLEAQKGAIVASSGKDHTLLDPRKTARSGTGRKARKSVSPLPGFVISGESFSVAHCLHFSRASASGRHSYGANFSLETPLASIYI